MGQLDDHRRRRDLRIGRIAEVRGQDADERPEPLAAGVDEMPGHGADELVVGLNSDPQARLDAVQAGTDGLLELGISELDADRGWTHLTSVAALVAQSRTSCGAMPRNTVAKVATVRAIVVDRLGTAIVAPFSGGSAKNINTTMRR